MVVKPHHGGIVVVVIINYFATYLKKFLSKKNQLFIYDAFYYFFFWQLVHSGVLLLYLHNLNIHLSRIVVISLISLQTVLDRTFPLPISDKLSIII